MTSTPLLSIVIPSYNYARFLPDCLNSIFNQTHAPSFEVVVVDDGSTDETPQVLEMYAEPRLRVVRHERNRGHITTINEALALARGTFVARIDPDDRYRPHFMAAVCRVLTQHPEVGFVYGRAALIDERGAETGPITTAPHEGDFKGSEFVRLLEQNFVCAPASAGRREAWLEHVPVPDGLAFNDWYFSVLIARTYPFYFLDDVIADYRVHGANHHARISKDGSEERSIFWLLDRVFEPKDDGFVFEPNREEVKDAVKDIQDFVSTVTTDLKFTVDKETGKTIVSVVDSKTKQVVRQIPAEEIMKIARNIDRMQGLLFSDKV